MKQLECEILIVGAGPAGLSTAIHLAQKGKKVIVIEKKQEIGVPIQCAEGIGSYLLPLLPFRIPDDILHSAWPIHGMHFFVDDLELRRVGLYWKGYVIDRKKLEQWMQSEAEQYGAKIYTNTELISLERDGDIVTLAIAKQGEEELYFKPKVLVAADGSDSKILKMIGEYNPKIEDVGFTVCWEVEGIKLEEPHREQMFNGEFAKGGYGFVFPKSSHSANIGIGVSNPQKDMKEYFNSFLELPHVKKQLENAKFIHEKSKKVVWGDLSDKWIYGNIFCVGDAANQNLKPFIEGILPSLITGGVCSIIVNKYLNQENVSHEEYHDLLHNTLGGAMDYSENVMRVAHDIFALNDPRLYILITGLATQLFEPTEIADLITKDYDTIRTEFLRRKQL